MGKNWLEETIIAEVESICQVLRDAKGKPFNPQVQLTNSVSNVICALIFGKKFALTDDHFSRLTTLISDNVRAGSVDFIVQSLPFLMSGTETTSMTTLWALVFMVEHPEVMRKVQEEIDSNVDREKVLTNAERLLLPYTGNNS
ncbi:hypothetical protein BV898_14624 [Hypsibius exemplaris]|uniref:Uncharacterized protein n=1 Tax=Hypsibius exemplaris TaxID=2072580 RepID=A0A9X6NAY3_HYPEX|nr:hypothetical protein BV898_14624 [Hypsibius exemplaris]